MYVVHIKNMTLDQFLSIHQMTNAEFAFKIGRDTSTVSRIRKSKTRPDWQTAAKINAATNGAVTPNDFMPTTPQVAA